MATLGLSEADKAAVEAFRQDVVEPSRTSLVIVDFWAAWCGPCRAMAPIFEQAARMLEPKARFIKVDVDANPDIASEYGVQGIPALLAFKNGNVVARQAGVTDLGTLRGWAERFST